MGTSLTQKDLVGRIYLALSVRWQQPASVLQFLPARTNNNVRSAKNQRIKLLAIDRVILTYKLKIPFNFSMQLSCFEMRESTLARPEKVSNGRKTSNTGNVRRTLCRWTTTREKINSKIAYQSLFFVQQKRLHDRIDLYAGYSNIVLYMTASIEF